jgi:predicted phage terminase large subunit-like protein
VAEQALQLGLPSELTEEAYQEQVKQTRLAMLSEEQYLDLLLRDGLEEEAQVVEAEESLRAYAKMMWPVMEAGQPMTTGWATDAICDHLQAVSEGHILNLGIFVPPGMAKSALTCVYFPTWEWGPRKMPHLRYITASYSEDLTLGTNRLSRALIDSDVYRKWWRKGSDGSELWTIDPKQDTKTEFATNKMGFRFATSTGGTITGKRGHRLIFDDLHSAQQAESDAIRTGQVTWFRESAQNRVVDAQTRKILIMQLLNANDAGAVAKELGWTILCLPMRYEHDHPLVWVGGPKYEKLSRGRVRLVQWGKGDPRAEERGGEGDGQLLFPERFPEDMVADLEEAMGDYATAGQFQQRPTPRGGGMFKKVDEIEPVYAHDIPYENLIIARGWDFAGSKKKGSAYTASAKVGLDRETGTLYILHGEMDRFSPDELEAAIVDRAEEDGPGVLQSMPRDPAQAGMFQAHIIAQKLQGKWFEFSLETGSKEDRAKPLASQVNIGKVKMLVGTWNDKVKEQLKTFPRGKYKDIADALSRAYMAVTMAQGQSLETPEAPKVVSAQWKVEMAYRTR